MHIHSGTGCGTDTLEGGHQYDPDGITDPWSGKGFGDSTVAQTVYSFYAVVDSQYTDINGKPFVVHDEAGNRLACGVLATATTSEYTTTMAAFPGYTAGTVGSVTEASGGGTITVVTAGVGLYVNADMTGMTASCSTNSITNGVTGAVCGLHVHSGTACTTTDVGGHYDFYSQNSNTAGTLPTGTAADPWGGAPTALDTSDYVTATATADYAVIVGTSYTDVGGNTFVYHDATKAKAMCGVLAVSDTGTSDSSTPGALLALAIAAVVAVLR